MKFYIKAAHLKKEKVRGNQPIVFHLRVNFRPMDHSVLIAGGTKKTAGTIREQNLAGTFQENSCKIFAVVQKTVDKTNKKICNRSAKKLFSSLKFMVLEIK